MKASDARAMTVDQLDDEVLKLKKEQFNLRFQRATGQLENTSRVRVVRRDIARMHDHRRAEADRRRAGGEAGRDQEAGSKPERAKAKRTAKRRPPVKSRSKPNLKIAGPRPAKSRRSKRIACRSERSRAWLSATSRTRP